VEQVAQAPSGGNEGNARQGGRGGNGQSQSRQGGGRGGDGQQGGGNAQGGETGGRRGDSAPSPECQAVGQRIRAANESGRQPTDEDRAKQRDCTAQMAGTGRTNRPSNALLRSGRAGRGGGGNPGGGRGGGGGGGGSVSRPRSTNRPGIVFMPGANGPEPRQVTLGYSDLDFTEVVNGLQEGEKVYLVTAARLLKQQQDNLDRMRQRMQGPVPGMANPGGGGPGGGGGGPRGGGGR
jgi:HlyD family secretion protein